MKFRNAQTVILNPSDLILTREDLDQKKIADMVEGLQKGTLYAEELTMPMVTPIEGSGYMVGDGNHSVSAMKKVGITQIECEIYKIKR